MALEIFTALAADYLGAKAVAGSGAMGAAGGEVIKRILRKRAEAAREILVDELRRGQKFKEEISEDEVAAVIFRYMRAAEEGAARRNLRFLAAVAAGQASHDGLYADDFLRWADVIASLAPEEVVVLGVAFRLGEKADFKIGLDGSFWGECLKVLDEEHGMHAVTSDSLAASLLRTGFMRFLGGLMDIGHAYLPTEKLFTLGRIVDIEGLIARSNELDGSPR